MKSQNIALILLLSLISASYSTNQLIVGAFSEYKLLTEEERNVLREGLKKIWTTEFSNFVQDIKKYSAILVSTQIVAGTNLRFLVVGINEEQQKLFGIEIYVSLNKKITLTKVTLVTVTLTPKEIQNPIPLLLTN